MSIGTFMDEDGYGSWAATPKSSTPSSPTVAQGVDLTKPVVPAGSPADEEGYGGAANTWGFATPAPTTSSIGTTPKPGVTTPKTGSEFDWQAFISAWEGLLAKQAADAKAAAEAAAKAQRESAWAVIKGTFDRYGLGDLVDSLKGIIIEGASEAEMLLKLRDTPAYKERFSANDLRIQNGLRALSEADYIDLEDSYANLMRKYGLPAWYTEQGKYGKQGALEQFIANDVSPVELEDRIQIAVNRVQNGPKEVLDTLKKFYPGINNGDVLAYILDPKKALPVLQRQVTAAEIGGEATRYGLNAELQTADTLAGLGVNQQQARSGYQAIGGGLERGRQLSGIYNEDPYTQKTAEAEVFGMNDANEAAKKRKRIIGREQATFGGSSGIRGGALEQNRAGTF
jgi:hypothetical protein